MLGASPSSRPRGFDSVGPLRGESCGSRVATSTLGFDPHRRALVSSACVAVATFDCCTPLAIGLRRPLELWFIPRLVVQPGPIRTRSGSASGLAPFVLSRLHPVGQIVVRSGVSSLCTGQNTRSRGIFEFTGLSTEKARNPQNHSVHPPSTHRLHTERPLFILGSLPRRGVWLTIQGLAGTMGDVTARIAARTNIIIL